MKKRSVGDKVFDCCNVIFMILLTLVFFIPFWVVLATSFVGTLESARRGAYQFYPEVFDISCYKVLLTQGSVIFRAYGVTIARTIIASLPLCL